MQGPFRTTALVLALLSASAPAVAQRRTGGTTTATSAANARSLVDRGRNLYDDQLYEESVQTLSAALLRPDGSEQDKRAVYQYLAYDYIVLGRRDEADSAARALFVLDPAFTLPANESPRLREFFNGAKAKWEAEGRPGLVEKQTPVAPVTLSHNPPVQVDAQKTFEVRGGITDPDRRVTSVKLFVRPSTKGRFESRPARASHTSFAATVPGVLVKGPIVEYYFQAYDRTGLPVASRGDAGLPLRVAVKDQGGGAWIAPVAIGAGVLGAAAVVGALALAGVFKGGTPPGPADRPPATPTSTVTVIVRE